MLPCVNIEAMNLHLAEISTQVAPAAHAVVTLDGAGWHKPGGKLIVPDNISLLALPPYLSPKEFLTTTAAPALETLAVSALPLNTHTQPGDSGSTRP